MADHVTTTLLIQSAPYGFACLIGLAVAFARRTHHPRLSAFVGLLLVLRLAVMLGSLAYTGWVYSSIDAGVDPQEIGVYSGFVNFLVSLLNAAIWLALIAAVFVGRQRSAPDPVVSPAAA